MASAFQQNLQKLRVRHVDPALRSFSKFWSWWIGELVATLPASTREAIANANKRVVVSLDEAEWVFTEGNNASQTKIAPDAMPEQISELILALPPDKVLQRTITLPIATEENLREVLSFEMDRHTPFAADQVYYDYRITGRNTAGATITLDLVVAPKKVVDEVLETMQKAGVVPDVISTRDGDAGDIVPVNLLPGSMRPRRRFSAPRLNTVLAAVSVALLIIALVLPPAVHKQRLDQLEQEVAAARSDAQGGLELRQQVERITKTSEFLTQKKLSGVLVLQILEEVSRILPDNTWLTRFDVNSSEIQLHGQSGSAAALIELLESSPLFRDARFRSPVVQVRQTDLEQFHLSVQLEAAEST